MSLFRNHDPVIQNNPQTAFYVVKKVVLVSKKVVPTGIILCNRVMILGESHYC